MRPIDADALLNWLDTEIDPEEWSVSQFNADWIYCFIDNAPTVDAVEVVKCKDCKSCWVHEPTNTHFCFLHDEAFRTMPTDFCNYGERREP